MTTAIITVSTTVPQMSDAMLNAYATRDEAFKFLTRHAEALKANPEALHVARYAYARACYREGRGMFIDNLALLNDMSVSGVAHFVQKLFGFEPTADTYLTNGQCSKIMSHSMEM